MFKIFLTAVALTLLLPSCDSASGKKEPSGSHKSTAIIQILPTTVVLTDASLRTENFIDNEIASLSMGVVITKAIEVKNWKERGLQLEDLQNSLKVERIEGTDMARITAFADDKSTAKEIVDSIISAYVSNRNKMEVDLSERSLEALDSEVIAQSDLVQDHRKDLTVLIQQYGIPYFENTPNPLGQTELEVFSDSKKQLHQHEIKLALLKKEQDVLERDKAIREKLLTQIEILSLQINALKGITDENQDNTVDLSLKQYTYNRAKESYVQSKDLLGKMKRRQQEARVALKMPRNPIFVRQRAN